MKDILNIVDVFIVLSSLADIILTTSNLKNGSSFAVIKAFRSLRLLRIFKLTRSFKTLKNILLTILITI